MLLGKLNHPLLPLSCASLAGMVSPAQWQAECLSHIDPPPLQNGKVAQSNSGNHARLMLAPQLAGARLCARLSHADGNVRTCVPTRESQSQLQQNTQRAHVLVRAS